MFEPPVGKAKGNFHSLDDDEEIFGYFYTTSEQLYRIYNSPEFAGNPHILCPNPDPA